MTLRITHLNLGVSDLQQTERFYRDALELPVERSGRDLCVRWDELTLVFTENPPSARGKFHIGFRVDDASQVDEWAQRLRTRNVRVIGEPISHGSDRRFYFLDPDQYELEIYWEGRG